MSELLFITAHPREATFKLALDRATQILADDTLKKVQVFFYSDAAYIANAFNWQPANEENLQEAWIKLAQAHDIRLNVCVSTALTRGITDTANSKRHQLYVPNTGDERVLANNLQQDFELVGLGVLAEYMHQADEVFHF